LLKTPSFNSLLRQRQTHPDGDTDSQNLALSETGFADSLGNLLDAGTLPVSRLAATASSSRSATRLGPATL